MITEKDFVEVLLHGSSEINMETQCFELAKKMCIDFAKYLSVNNAEGKFKMYQEWKPGEGKTVQWGEMEKWLNDNCTNIEKHNLQQYSVEYNGVKCMAIVNYVFGVISLEVIPKRSIDNIGQGAGGRIQKTFV